MACGLWQWDGLWNGPWTVLWAGLGLGFNLISTLGNSHKTRRTRHLFPRCGEAQTSWRRYQKASCRSYHGGRCLERLGSGCALSAGYAGGGTLGVWSALEVCGGGGRGGSYDLLTFAELCWPGGTRLHRPLALKFTRGTLRPQLGEPGPAQNNHSAVRLE